MQVRVVSAESTEDCRYPLEVMPDVGVDTGKARPRAAVAERRETNERPATVDVVRQRTTAVTLYTSRTTHVARSHTVMLLMCLVARLKDQICIAC